MRQGLLGVCVGFLLSASPAAATPIVVNFSATPDGSFGAYTESGVTFTTVDGSPMTSTEYSNTPAGSRGLIGLAVPYVNLMAAIASGASSVSVDLGDYNIDEDVLFLDAFDASNASLGSASQFIPSTFVGMVTLQVSAPNISYVIFGGRQASALLSGGVYSDNFSFEPASTPVPEPTSLLLFGSGVAGFIATAYRRKKRAAQV